MDISDWRLRIDELDRKLVELLNERATAAHAIGLLKRDTQMPIYEPERENEIFQKICRQNRGPLPDTELVHIYERILEVMRNMQRYDVPPVAGSSGDQK